MISAKPDKKQKGKVVLTKGTKSVRVDPLSPVSITRAANALEVDESDVDAALAPDDGPAEFTVFNGDQAIEEADPLLALDDALGQAKPDDFLRWQGRDRLCAVDIDVFKPQSWDWLVSLAERSGAQRAWLTKSKGGRLVFTDEGHAAAAVVLLGMAEPDYVRQVELLHNTRAPRGEVLKRLGGDITWLRAVAAGEDLDEIDREEVDSWLEREGLSKGRNPHVLCPINPDGGVGAGEPVTVLERGVYCHRCAGVDGDGWRPWSRLLGVAQDPHPLVLAAQEQVHWAHQRIVMRAQWTKKVPWWVARRAYEALLGGADVFDSNWLWFRSESGAWINPKTGGSEGLGEAISTLSWAQGNPARRQQARNAAPLAGVTPIRPCGVCLRPDAVPEGVVVWARRPDVDPWREGLDDWPTAFAQLVKDFPKCDELYLKLCLVAAVCAEGGRGKFLLLVTGTSGSAKSTIPRIAAGIMGAESADLRLDVSVEEWRRQIGQALESGRRPLIVNEVDKVPGFRQHLQKVLQLQDPHQWRPLYGTDVTSKWRAPMIVTAINPPEAFEDAEMGRRFRHIELIEKVPSWYGKELEGWRLVQDEREKSLGLPPWRAKCADSLLRWALDFAREHGNDWDACADALGVLGSDEADPEDREIVLAAYRGLYEHCCSADRELSKIKRYPGTNGWVDLRSKAATEILEPVMPDVQSAELYVLRKQLESFNWAGLLGGPIRCEVRLRNSRLVGRFVSQARGKTGGLRGHRLVNEETQSQLSGRA